MGSRTRITVAGFSLGATLLGGVAWAMIPGDGGVNTACKAAGPHRGHARRRVRLLLLTVALYAIAGAPVHAAAAATGSPSITADPQTFGSGQIVSVKGQGFAPGQTVHIWYDGNGNVVQDPDEPSTVSTADAAGFFSGAQFTLHGPPQEAFIRAGTPAAVAQFSITVGSCWMNDCFINGNDTICILGNSPDDLLSDCKALDSSYSDASTGYNLNNGGPRFAGAAVLAAAVNDLGLPGTGCAAMTAAIALATASGNAIPNVFNLDPDHLGLLNIACGVPVPIELASYISFESLAGHGSDPAIQDARIILQLVGTTVALGGGLVSPVVTAAQQVVAQAAVTGAIACGHVDYFCNGLDITFNIMLQNNLQPNLVPLLVPGFFGKRWGDIIGWAMPVCSGSNDPSENTLPAKDSNGNDVKGPCETGTHPRAVPGSAGPNNTNADERCATGTVTGMSIGYDGDISFDVNDGPTYGPDAIDPTTNAPYPPGTLIDPLAPGPGIAPLTNYHNFQPGPGGSDAPGGIDVEIPRFDMARFLPQILAMHKGASVTVCGRWVADMHQLWNELHPVTQITIPAVATAPPVVTPHVTGTVGSNDWYTSDIGVTWTVTGETSSVGCTPSAITVDTSGQTLSCSATNADGTTVQPLTLKLDKTPPTISQFASPASRDGTNGWYRTPPFVTFSCADLGSGVATCPLSHLLPEGTGQTSAGAAVDNAGNEATSVVSGLNVDQTPPQLSGAARDAPNSAGWYSADVVVGWTCSDALSGIPAGGCPADEAVTGEGASLTANESVSDVAGNVTSAASAPVRIDRTVPLTTATAPSGWSSTGVTVGLAAIDNLSGVAATYFRVDGGLAQAGTSVTIGDEGVHAIAYWSADVAGNIEPSKTLTVLIDKTAPTISHNLDPAPNAASWNRSSVTVTFICGDALSEIASCTLPQLLTGEGRSQPVNGTARDNAANVAHDTALVSIDKTAPTITADTDRAANAAGWYNAPVRVSFTCTDGLSGIGSCPNEVTLTEGGSQSATGTARDLAGNEASTTLAHISIDTTAPTVAYAGNAGVYTVDATVAITCSASDGLSGLVSTTCANVSGPAWSFGLGTTSRSASALDRAGNTGNGSTSFTVLVTEASLDNLITRFFGNGQTGSSGLIAELDAIVTAPTANAKTGKLGAFDNEVDAKLGNPLTAAQAALLKQFAAAL
jgi:hypothetical protein